MATLDVKPLDPPHKDGNGVTHRYAVINLDDVLPNGQPNVVYTARTKEDAESYAKAAPRGIRKAELLTELAALEEGEGE